jgi:hypothetical protein
MEAQMSDVTITPGAYDDVRPSLFSQPGKLAAVLIVSLALWWGIWQGITYVIHAM